MMKPLAGMGLLFFVLTSAHAGKLRSPWDDAKITATDVPYACPAPPQFATTIDVEGYYTDKNYSIIDPKKLDAFNAASEGPTHLGQYAGLAADDYLAKGSRAAAECVYSLLDAAAKADAWDGKMPQVVDIYLQNWMLSGTALSYLKVRNSGVGTPEQAAAIERWFALVAARVRDYFDMQRTKPGSDAFNNHMYWAGLSVAAQGIADDDEKSFVWGMATYRMGVNAIQPDGSLIAEMKRAGMAEHYQLYALGPLVMLAELGAANGLDLYAEDDGAIHRLVKFSVAGLENPSIIAKRTGVAQNLPAQPSGLEIGWSIPYVKRFPDAHISALHAKAQWTRFWQWGGAPPDPVIPPPPLTGEGAAFAASLQQSVKKAFAAEFPPPSQGFFGGWCAQGDSAKHTSISSNGAFLTLTNENGETSTAESQSENGIFAAAWEYVSGTLSPDGSQIDWSNGSFWARCHVGRDRRSASLSGTWYPQGIRSMTCSIQQRGNHLQLDNGQFGGKATGQTEAAGHLATDWSGNHIKGAVTADGNHITWDNGTYWTRLRASPNK